MALWDAAMASPSKDWSTQAGSLMVVPLRNQLVAIVKDTAKRGQRITGQTVVYPKVIKVDHGDVTVKACVDTRDTDFIGRDGKSIRVPDQKGAYRVHPMTVIVTQFGRSWLIRSDSSDLDTRCTVE